MLAYARERDLLHPEDIGTMTHWYSRTPKEYLDKVKPDFVPQTTGAYSSPSGLVWDIRQDKNMEAYWKLTEAHIREYGAPDIFHTIGLAERRCYNDRESNQQMKLYAYRRIQKILREHYPNAPLLIASWDFCMYWEAEEVRELLSELDPDHTLIFDYTSDTDDESRNFQNWGVIGRFPWVFGVFQAYEPATEPRGNYAVIARRLRIAADDPMCRGFILWPENSHGDTLMIEFCAANSWDPKESNREIDSFVGKFCAERYDAAVRDRMLGFWKKALPVIQARHWHGPGIRRDHAFLSLNSDYVFQTAVHLLPDRYLICSYERAKCFSLLLGPVQPALVDLLRSFAEIKLGKESEFVRRDIFDLIRCCGSRGLCFAFCRLVVAIHRWKDGQDNQAEVEERFADLRKAEELFAAVLGAWDEFSLYASLKDLQAKHRTNPKFEYTLKGNAENHYCRSFITELFTQIYIPELDVCREIWREVDRSGGKRTLDNRGTDPRLAAVKDKFYATPLKDIAPDAASAMKKLPANLKKLADQFERIYSNPQ